MLVPFIIGRCTAALLATGVGLGSTTTSFGGFGPVSRSRMRIQVTACVSAMLWPKSRMVSAWFISA